MAFVALSIGLLSAGLLSVAAGSALKLSPLHRRMGSSRSSSSSSRAACYANPDDWSGPLAAASPLAPFSVAQRVPQWGHYRPSVYWGLRTRSFPAAAAVGLMWASASAPVSSGSGGGGDNSTSTGARRRSRAAALRSLSSAARVPRGRRRGAFRLRPPRRPQLCAPAPDRSRGRALPTHFAKPDGHRRGGTLRRRGGFVVDVLRRAAAAPGPRGRRAGRHEWVARIAGFSSPKR